MLATPEITLSLPVASLDMLRLGDEIAALEGSGVAELLFPVGDGAIAPFMTGVALARQISGHTKIPCHALLLSLHPERHIDAFAGAGFAAMTISFEASTHHHRMLTRIREAGMKAGIAVNPTTSLTALDYLLDKSDCVCLLGCEPDDESGHTVHTMLCERVKMLRDIIQYRELRAKIMPYSGLDLTLAKQALQAGASIIALEPRMIQDGKGTTTLDAITKCLAALSATDGAL